MNRVGEKRRKMDSAVDSRRDRRFDLITAGIELLSQPGSTARVADITTKADTAKGTFYLYFESWGRFLAAIRDYLLAEYQREMNARLEELSKDNYWSMFASEVEYFIRWMLSHGNLHRSVFHAAEVTTGVPIELSANKAIIDLLETGKRFGFVCASAPSEVSGQLIFRTLHSAVGLIEGANTDAVIVETVRFTRAAVAVLETR